MHCAMRDWPPSGRRRLLDFVSGRSGWQQTIRWCAFSVGRWLGAKAKLVHYTTASGLSGLCAMGGCDKGARGRASAMFKKSLDVPVVGVYGL